MFYDNRLTEDQIKKLKINERWFNTETEICYNTGSNLDVNNFDIRGNYYGDEGRTVDEYGFNYKGINKETGYSFNKNGFNIEGVYSDYIEDLEGFISLYYGFKHEEGYEEVYENEEEYQNLYLNYAKKKLYHRKTNIEMYGFNYSDSGFNIDEIHITTSTKYNPLGYDMNGFDENGFDKEGLTPNKEKYNKDGLDVNGFNKDRIYKDTESSYDTRSFDSKGINSKNGKKYDDDGYDIRGFNSEGFNKKNLYKDGIFITDYLLDTEYCNSRGFKEGIIRNSRNQKENYHKATGTEYDEFDFDFEGKYKEGGKFNDKGFKYDKTYRETGNKYTPDGYNIEGRNKYGFSKEGGKHKETGTKYNLKGFNEYGEYKETGEKYDPEGYDIDGNHKSNKEKHREVLNWENELRRNFKDEIIDNGSKVNYKDTMLPEYVIDYIVSNFEEIRSKEEDKNIEIQEYLDKYIIKSGDQKIKLLELWDRKKIKIIDKFKGNIKEILEKKVIIGLRHFIDILDLDITVDVNNNLFKENKRLLKDGLWGIGEIELKKEDNRYHYEFSNFQPFQIKEIDLEKYKKARKEFEVSEWIDILINTIGLNHENYERREKLILISRIIPMVEENIFMMEFSSPGTGKTYTYESVSSYSRVIAGSIITAPQLFYNSIKKEDGVLLKFDSILLDEIDKIGDLDKEILGKLYQYLSSGKFDRGEIEKIGSTSLMMAGNLPDDYKKYQKGSLLKDNLKENLTHTALLDRLAGIIPGWELPPIKNPKNAYTKSLSFSKDYFSEILHEMKNIVYYKVLARIKYDDSSTQRDKQAISKIVNGMVKLIYPHGDIDKSNLEELVELAVEYRNSGIKENNEINNQKLPLVKMPTI